MARKKVTLAYIPSDATRRATLKKRRKGLMKKVAELSVLCGVPACAVVYSPEAELPEIYPSLERAKEILTDLTHMPEVDKNKKMVNQKTFLEQRLLKLRQQVRRLEHENRELAGAVSLRRCLGGVPVEVLSREDADGLLELVDRRAKAVVTRMHQLGAAAVEPMVAVPVAERAGFDAAAIEAMRRYDWIGCDGGMDYCDGGAGMGGGVAGEEDVLAMLLEQELLC